MSQNIQHFNKILQLIQFQDGRIHAQFKDNSSIIVQKGQECITYFSNNGENFRFFLSNCIVKTEIQSKINLLFKIRNSLTDDYYHIQQKQEMLIYKNQKIQYTLWDQNSIIEDNEGLQIVSLDKYCSVKLFNNRKCFTTSVLQILPKKESQYEIKNQKVSLVYQYIMVNKLFPLQKYPERFTIPIQLLLKYLNEKYDEQHQVQDIFPSVIQETSNLDYSVLCKHLKQQTALMSQLFNDTEQSKQLNSDKIWKDDQISPNFDMLNQKQKGVYVVRNNTVSWFFGKEFQTFILQDLSFIESTLDSSFYHHIFENLSKKIYNIDSIPVIIRNKSMKYSIDGDIKEIVKVSFHNQNFQDQLVIQPDNENYDFSDDILQQEINQIGTFISYKNHSIKIHFKDRTILRYNGKQFSILTKFGDQLQFLQQNLPIQFNEYATIAATYFDESFLSVKEKQQRELYNQQLQYQIQYELQKNQRFLMISQQNQINQFNHNTYTTQSLNLQQEQSLDPIQQQIQLNNQFLLNLQKSLNK